MCLFVNVNIGASELALVTNSTATVAKKYALFLADLVDTQTRINLLFGRTHTCSYIVVVPVGSGFLHHIPTENYKYTGFSPVHAVVVYPEAAIF
jgi:hypothetical protein